MLLIPRWFQSMLVLGSLVVFHGTATAAPMDDLMAGQQAAIADERNEAIRLLTRALDSGQLPPQAQLVAHKHRATAFSRSGQHQQAVADYDAIIKISPNDEAAYYDRGLSHVFLVLYDLAIADFDAAIRLKPGYQSYQERGKAYAAKGQHDRAIADFDMLIKLNPSPRSSGYSLRAASRFASGQYAGAAADLDEVVKGYPTSAHWMLWQHIANLRSGKASATEFGANTEKIDRARWPGAAIALFAGRATPEQVREAAKTEMVIGGMRIPGQLQRQSCEASFYMGMYELLRKNNGAARTLLQEAAADSCRAAAAARIVAIAELERL